MEGPKLGHLKDLGVASEEFVGIKITACESGEEDSDLEKVDQGELEKQYKADLCSPQTLALTKISRIRLLSSFSLDPIILVLPMIINLSLQIYGCILNTFEDDEKKAGPESAAK